MATDIVIFDKLHEKEGNVHYYKITSPTYKDSDMYVKIDNKRKVLEFFLTSTFKNPVKTLSFPSSDLIGSIEGKNRWVYTQALMKIARMIRENEFPDQTCHVS